MGVPVNTATDINGKVVDVSHLTSDELLERVRADDETRLNINHDELEDFFRTSEKSELVLKDIAPYVSSDDLQNLQDKLDNELETLGED